MNKTKRILICAIFFFSCKTHIYKNFSSTTPLIKKEEINNKINNTKTQTSNISINSKFTIQNREKQQVFFAEILIKKNKFFILSIKDPFLGIEISKIKATSDSIYYINHLKNEWFVQPKTYMKKYFNKNITFLDIQEFLLAERNISEEGYKIFSEKEKYVLTAKKSYKEYEINKNTLNYSKIKEDDIEITYLKYKKYNKVLLPTSIVLKINKNESITVITIKHSKLNIKNKIQDSFQIPKKYAKIQ